MFSFNYLIFCPVRVGVKFCNGILALLNTARPSPLPLSLLSSIFKINKKRILLTSLTSLFLWISWRLRMRTVLITGASRGIGLGLVRGFLRTANTRVVATARRPEAAAELAAVLKGKALASNNFSLNFKSFHWNKSLLWVYRYILLGPWIGSPAFQLIKLKILKNKDYVA